MLFLAAAGRRQGAVTPVDEAFIDYAPAGSVTRDAATIPHLIAVRSLTKFFGVPSLRVGYAIARPDLARRMRAQLPSWPVTALAMVAFTAALADLAYAQRTLTENAFARAALADDLRGLGLHVGPSAANFLLMRLPAGSPCAAELVERLILDHGIVVRDCSSYEGFTQHSYHQGPSEGGLESSERETSVHIEFVAAVRVDVLPNKRRELDVILVSRFDRWGLGEVIAV
jgi:histidinol-phosphate/aromatic aminotransferase/cobyric acid decarboxylase-like protein